jgi:hypothetical protein
MLTAPQQLYITRQALKAIEAEAQRYADTQGVGHETGGILIGRRLVDQPDTVLIIIATGPGEHAVRTPVEFSPDVQYVNRQLSAARAIYSDSDYIGTWHKHPSTYRTFSPGDVYTAHAIFSDPSYVVDEIINPIVWIDDGKMTAHYYYMSREMARRDQDFAQLDNQIVELIPDDHPLVQRERARRSGGSGHLPPLWVDDERGRLQSRGYSVQVRHERGQQAYLFVVTNPLLAGVTITFVASEQDYPGERPQIFIEGTGRNEPLNSDDAYDDLERRLARIYLADIADAIVGDLRSYRQGAGRAAPLKLIVAPAPDPGPPASPAAEAVIAQALKTPRSRIAAPRMLWPLLTVGLLAVAALVVLLWPRAPQTPTTDYAALWVQIESALQQPSEESLRAAIEHLGQIRSEDPGGFFLAQNRNVTDTLVLAYNRLGDQLVALSPPDLDGADQAFFSALSLSPQDPTAQAGYDQVRVSLKATAAASAQQEVIAQRWQNVDTASDNQLRVTLIQALLTDGIAFDPDGTPISERLQSAIDDRASDLLTNAAAALQQGDRAAALTALRAVGLLNPAPSSTIRATASEQLRQIEADISAEKKLFSEAWAAYDRAISDKNVVAAISALEAIMAQTREPLPDPSGYLGEGYDPRIAQAGLLLVDAQLSYAGDRQRAGDMDAARAQYEATAAVLRIMEQSRRLEGEVATRRSSYESQLTEFTQGETYWIQFNALFAAGKLREALKQLDGLSKLPTFGREARKPPNTSQTVSTLMAQVNRLLNPPTAVPPTAVLPTSEPTPQPTSEPAPPEQTSEPAP